MTELELIIGRVIQAFGVGQVRVIQARRHGEKHLVFFCGRGRAPVRLVSRKDSIIPSVLESSYKKQTFRFQNWDSDIDPFETFINARFNGQPLVSHVFGIIKSAESQTDYNCVSKVEDYRFHAFLIVGYLF